MNSRPSIVTRTAPRSWDGCMPQTNDERRAEWAARYFSQGHHRSEGRMQVDTALNNYSIDEHTGCWNWNSSVANNGYGQARINGKVRSMHRFFFESFNGPIPDGLLICHRCNNKQCVNPSHLYAGTVLENATDALKAGSTPRGERVHNAKLTTADVLFIRESSLGASKIAEKFDISKWAVFDIRSGRRWSHLGHAGHHRPKPRIRVKPRIRIVND